MFHFVGCVPHTRGQHDECEFEFELYRPDQNGRSDRFALTTNTLRDWKIAGPGFVLHMRFQLFVILWALALCIGYISLCRVQGVEIGEGTFLKGGTQAGDARELCALSQPGAREDEDLSVTKLSFLVFAYLFTVVASVVFSLNQEFNFLEFDGRSHKMKNFAIVLAGLPTVNGKTRLEKEIAEYVKTNTELVPVGVSVCWDYKRSAEVVENIMEADLEQIEVARDAAHWQAALQLDPAEAGPPSLCGLGGLLRLVDNFWRETIMGVPLDPLPPPPSDAAIKTWTESLQSSQHAFVVFDSEEDRDVAIYKLSQESLPRFRKTDRLLALECKMEPTGVLWQNFEKRLAGTTLSMRLNKVLMTLAVCLTIWTVAVTLPVAYYVTVPGYVRHHGDLGSKSWFWLTVSVVANNRFLHYACERGSRHAGFGSEDERQVCFNILFAASGFISSMVNVLGTGFIAYFQMVAEDSHTADGRLVKDLTSLQEIIECYPMQQALGNVLFASAFPGTFLLPFVVEGVFNVYLTTLISMKVVGFYPMLRGRSAEKALSPYQEMTSGRYAEISYNTMLAVTVFFFAEGYTLPMLIGMALSHFFVLIYDHVRVIRVTPVFYWADSVMDRAAMALMVVPAGIVLCGALFYCSYTFMPDADPRKVLGICVLGFFVHGLLHLKILLDVLPSVARTRFKATSAYYTKVATMQPANYFSCNPIHVLRSRYILEEDPPAAYYTLGKEHCMWPSPAAGTFYLKPGDVTRSGQGGAVEAEAEDIYPRVKDARSKAQAAKAKAGAKAAAKAQA
eukprot:TRINITY_DN33931_c0_g1_i2.p1 TRINITY_DN33931_c0_g1~~TRINITY_DN33931_c0_g1_i2.p1  ORF type:complete len:789 (-),score=201.18 TRINITY_DN33931_c0_g1_i2:24-2390(-)